MKTPRGTGRRIQIVELKEQSIREMTQSDSGGDADFRVQGSAVINKTFQKDGGAADVEMP